MIVIVEKNLRIANLQRLEERRENVCLKFFKKNVESEKPLLSKPLKSYATRDRNKIDLMWETILLQKCSTIPCKIVEFQIQFITFSATIAP